MCNIPRENRAWWDLHLVVRQVEHGQVLAVHEGAVLELGQRVVAQVHGRLVGSQEDIKS
jgi:hypothetical protein